MTFKSSSLRSAAIAGALASTFILSACAPLLIGGAAVGGVMLYSDRRSSGTQVDDQTIELKAKGRVGDIVGDRGHVTLVSYNKVVLISGEVPTDADKAAVEQAVARVEGVRYTLNELAVGPSSSLTTRSNDVMLVGKVKATYVDAKDLQVNAFKVVVERGTVYLMGRVTEREAERATELARSVSGVQKVVRAFEIVSEAELANLRPQQNAQPAATTVKN
jgi:osmotically-inducible protein OsmY